MTFRVNTYQLSYEQRVAGGLCRVCGEVVLQDLFSLGQMPPVNAFVQEDEKEREQSWPLVVGYCPACLLVQLRHTVPPQRLYAQYLHLSSGASAQVAHLQNVAQLITERFQVTHSTRVLEVGSNDGTLLKNFIGRAGRVLGVDPAQNLQSQSRERSVETIPDFLSEPLAERMREQSGQFDIIVALNVVAHTENVLGLVRAIKHLLAPGGVFFMEAAYVLDTVVAGQFDTVYHEHVYFFSLRALQHLLKRAGLTVIAAEIIPTQGTSLRVMARHQEEDPAIEESVDVLLKRELDRGLTDDSALRSLGAKVEQFKREFTAAVATSRQRGPLVGLGAPARGVVILNACGIGREKLQYIVDDTPLKQQRLMPGVHIPVYSWARLEKETPAGFVLLSWNYRDDFMARLRRMKKTGTVIVPFPQLKEVAL